MSDGFFKPEDCNITSYQKFVSMHPQSKVTADCITLDKANRLLREKGTVVTGGCAYDDNYYWTNKRADVDTHTALLINIQPIEVADTAEKIANDLANYKFDHEVGHRFREFVERARKLLSKGE